MATDTQTTPAIMTGQDVRDAELDYTRTYDCGDFTVVTALHRHLDGPPVFSVQIMQNYEYPDGLSSWRPGPSCVWRTKGQEGVDMWSTYMATEFVEKAYGLSEGGAVGEVQVLKNTRALKALAKAPYMDNHTLRIPDEWVGLYREALDRLAEEYPDDKAALIWEDQSIPGRRLHPRCLVYK